MDDLDYWEEWLYSDSEVFDEHSIDISDQQSDPQVSNQITNLDSPFNGGHQQEHGIFDDHTEYSIPNDCDQQSEPQISTKITNLDLSSNGENQQEQHIFGGNIESKSMNPKKYYPKGRTNKIGSKKSRKKEPINSIPLNVFYYSYMGNQIRNQQQYILNTRSCISRPENIMNYTNMIGSFPTCHFGARNGKGSSYLDVEFKADYIRPLTEKKVLSKNIVIRIHNDLLVKEFGFNRVSRDEYRCIGLYYEHYRQYKDQILSFLEKNKELIRNKYNIK